MAEQIAKIAVENTAYSFDDAFDYSIPASLSEQVQPGVRVLVPFGRNNQKRQGIVFALRERKPNTKLKAIVSVLDAEPILNNEMLRLAVFLKERTFCTLFDAARAMFPSGIGLHFVLSYLANPEISLEQAQAELTDKEYAIFSFLYEKGTYQKKDTLCKTFDLPEGDKTLEQLQERGYFVHNLEAQKKITDATVKMAKLTGLLESDEVPIRLTKKQKEVVSFLEQTKTASVKEICYFTGVTPAVVTTLYKRQIIELFQNEIYRRPSQEVHKKAPQQIVLTAEQEKAYTGILSQMQAKKPGGALLFGVTGSGKTQVFLKLIDDCLQNGKDVIMMVPEISLTPQMLSIFYERYGDAVAVFHSALSMGERVDEWKRVKRGQAKIALGTRSAVFAPFEHLGLVIMDEEQEHTYKSEMTPRYHAREVAQYRTAYQNALLLLASATPSIESYTKAQCGQMQLYTLEHRYGQAVLPEVLCVNEATSTRQIGDTLLKAIQDNLEQQNQTVLLLNRRGYNTFASCSQCGKVMTCPNCSISLTYHQRNQRLMCHYCGYSKAFTTTCPECGAENAVVYSGIGTQRLEDELAEVLPKARILRLDTDTTTSKYTFEKELQKFTNHEYDILLGTQMVAKGLDFPKVTLVGVLSIDQLLYNDDYKSAERTFDLLTQVIGRAGRGEQKGTAIIQTAFPDNDVIRLAQKQDFPAFYQLDMQIRRGMVYPPYCDLCTVGFQGIDEVLTRSAAKYFLENFKKEHMLHHKDSQVIVLGPIAPRMAKVSGKYRYRIILKCRATRTFSAFLAEQIKQFMQKKEFKKIGITAEINPENIF